MNTRIRFGLLALVVACGSEQSTDPSVVPGTSMQSLTGSLSSGELPLPAGYFNGAARDVNDNMVAVGSANPDDPLTPQREGTSVAMRWVSMDAVTVLPNPLAGIECSANQINEHGTAVGTCLVAGTSHVIEWAPDGGVADLGPGSAAFINNRGDVAYVDAGRIHVRDKHGTVEDRGTGGGASTRIFGINNRGDIVGETEAGARAAEVFVLHRRGTRTVIPPSDPGNFAMPPIGGINDAGQVAGEFRRRGFCGASNPNPTICAGAWRWSKAEGYLEFETTLTNDVQVGDINNDGLIAGSILEYDTPPPRPAIVWNWSGARVFEVRIGRFMKSFGLNGLGLDVGEVTYDVPSDILLKYTRPMVF